MKGVKLYKDRAPFVSRDEAETYEFFQKHTFGYVKTEYGDYKPQQGKIFFSVSNQDLSDRVIKYVYQMLPDEVLQNSREGTPFALEYVINYSKNTLVHRWKVFCRDYDDEAATETAKNLLALVEIAYKVVGGLSTSGTIAQLRQNDLKMQTKKSSTNGDRTHQGRASTADQALARSNERYNLRNSSN